MCLDQVSWYTHEIQTYQQESMLQDIYLKSKGNQNSMQIARRSPSTTASSEHDGVCFKNIMVEPELWAPPVISNSLRNAQMTPRSKVQQRTRRATGLTRSHSMRFTGLKDHRYIKSFVNKQKTTTTCTLYKCPGMGKPNQTEIEIIYYINLP